MRARGGAYIPFKMELTVMKTTNPFLPGLQGLLMLSCLAATQPLMAAPISIDGNASDWTAQDRLDLPPGSPVAGYQLYGRYEDNAYKLLLKSDNRIIGTGTTIWLDTDQNVATGYQIFGSMGGAEYNINIHTDGKPYLYTGAAAQNYVGGPLTHVQTNSGTGSVLEMVIPETMLGTPSGTAIRLLLDINDQDFMPSYYTSSNLYVLRRQALPPANTSAERRIGIVHSKTTADRFWAGKSYSQLFMTMQMQAIMAGIPFDLLTEEDLTDLNKVIQYDTLVFPYFANVPDASFSQIEQNLSLASTHYQVGIITAGDFMTSKADGSSLPGDAYARMKNLLGISRVSGEGPVPVTVKVTDTSHPVLKGEYQQGETLMSYEGAYTSYFAAAGTETVTTLATQTVNNATRNAVLASQKGGRNVHFATLGMMADANLLWSALRWSVYGDAPLAGLQLGRDKALFVSRNDMDQSMYQEELKTGDAVLLSRYLKPWKNRYNFVGSYYINIGNDEAAGQYTDWTVSAPLFTAYKTMGNEIGTHSYTHPFNTNLLDAEQLRFEFADSRAVIEQKLSLSNLGAAVPGAPEDLRTAQEILKHVSYLSGGYSGVGAGFPGAMGYLTPADANVYLSPNMSFDFTLIEFKKMTADQAKQKWSEEFDALTKHAKRAVIHWPWHDYGPTNFNNNGYNADMFESLISKAYKFGVEFVTGADISKRIGAHRNSHLEATQVDANTVNVKLQSDDAGRFGIDIPQASSGKVIKSVDGWYAYNANQVFSDKDGGSFNVRLGTAADVVTRITQLPARANLLNLTGNGEDLSFKFEGEGKATIKTKCGTIPAVTGVSSFTFNPLNKTLTLKFAMATSYDVQVNMTCP